MSDKSKKIMIWAVVVVVVIVTAVLIVLGIMQPAASQGSSGFATTTAPAITSADHIQGDPTSTVSLIEYGDFQCPACGEYYSIVEQVLSNYGSKISFVFRNFPLPQHADAPAAAEAAEAAGLQGKYWQMYDLLYQNQNTWSNASPGDVVSQFFDGYAKSLGLNVDKFNADMTSAKVADKIAGDVKGGDAASIDHTPTFFVNLQQIPNPSTYDQFKSILDQALSSSGS